MAAPRRPPRRTLPARLPAPGRARHVLSAVRLPLLLGTPGKEAPRGWKHWLAGSPAIHCRFPVSRACATCSSCPAPGRAGVLRNANGWGPQFPLNLTFTPPPPPILRLHLRAPKAPSREVAHEGLEPPQGEYEHPWAGLAGTHVAGGGLGCAGSSRFGARGLAWTL